MKIFKGGHERVPLLVLCSLMYKNSMAYVLEAIMHRNRQPKEIGFVQMAGLGWFYIGRREGGGDCMVLDWLYEVVLVIVKQLLNILWVKVFFFFFFKQFCNL